MKILGLVTEYNPFHNGHLYHLNKSKEITGATHTIAVMSGNFVQRGEPAIVHKWERAKMAIRSGVDLVIELPTLYASSTAEFFAHGAISLLSSLNLVDYVCFGSEIGDLDLIKKIANILVASPYQFEEILKEYVNVGFTFPLARSKALIKYFKDIAGYKDQDLSLINSIMKSPNNILGIEYLKAIKRINSLIIPYTINRAASDYHSKEISRSITSATAIRDFIFNNRSLEGLSHTMPGPTLDILLDNINKGLAPIHSEDFSQPIFSILRRSRPEDLKNIFDVTEGLENKIYDCSIKTNTLNELYGCIKSKRYTLTRIQRILIHSLLNINREDILASTPQYARILAFNSKGREILKGLKSTSSIPVITNLKHYKPQNTMASKMIDIDIRATNIYSLGFKSKSNIKAPLDYTMNPFYE